MKYNRIETLRKRERMQVASANPNTYQYLCHYSYEYHDPYTTMRELEKVNPHCLFTYRTDPESLDHFIVSVKAK